MVKVIGGVGVFLLGLCLLSWIGYNLFIDMTPEAQGRSLIMPIIVSIGFMYVGQLWIRNGIRVM